MTKLIALSGRAMFDRDSVALDRQEPHYAWMLFTWKVNEMVPEVFATKGSYPDIIYDEPAIGWKTEKYERARIMLPPVDTDDMVIISADDPRLYMVWDQAYQMVVASGLHDH